MFSNLWCSDYLKMDLQVKKLNLGIFTHAPVDVNDSSKFINFSDHRRILIKLRTSCICDNDEPFCGVVGRRKT